MEAQMNIELAEALTYDDSMGAVLFTIQCDSVSYRGAVSTEALRECFGLDNPHVHGALDAFAANRHLIEAKVRERFSTRRPDDIFLRTSDF